MTRNSVSEALHNLQAAGLWATVRILTRPFKSCSVRGRRPPP